MPRAISLLLRGFSRTLSPFLYNPATQNQRSHRPGIVRIVVVRAPVRVDIAEVVGVVVIRGAEPRPAGATRINRDTPKVKGGYFLRFLSLSKIFFSSSFSRSMASPRFAAIFSSFFRASLPVTVLPLAVVNAPSGFCLSIL